MMYRAITTDHTFRRLRHTSLLLAGLLLLGLTCMPRTARAACGFYSGSATTVTYTVGAIITLDPNTQPGTELWTSGTVSPANPPDVLCGGNTNSGIFNTIAGSPTGGDDTLFPTNIPGISYRLLHPDAGIKLRQYPNYLIDGGTFSIETRLQLVYTGPDRPPNNSVLSGQLSQWKVDICDKPIFNWFFGYYYAGCNGSVSPTVVETFNINAIIKILVPTCNIEPGSKNKSVTLPPVLASQFTGTNSTTGSKHFTLNLTDCPNHLGVSIALDANHPWTGSANGVIAPAPGANQAQNVGVQVLKKDGTTPVTFGDAFLTGTTSGNHSDYAIDLYARYYQTGTPVTGGEVNATATYTLAYQ